MAVGAEKDVDPLEPFRYGSYYFNKIDSTAD